MAEHCFLIEDVGSFIANLAARRYLQGRSDSLVVYSKPLSGPLINHYAYHATDTGLISPIKVRVSYELVADGKPLLKLVNELKYLNFRYRQMLPGWKTKREPSKNARENRWLALQRFLNKHAELIG